MTYIRSSLSEDGQVVTVKTVGDARLALATKSGYDPLARSWCLISMEEGFNGSVKEAS